MQNISEVMAMIDGREQSMLILFWVLYSLISVGIIFGFFALTNDWLEDKTKWREF
jgi:hypothetical protein